MLAIEMQDLLDVLKLCVPYIAVMIVALIVFLIVEIFAGKFNKKKSGKFMLRSQAAVAFVLVIAVVVNLLCVGPMSNLLTLVSGSGMITDETAAEAEELGEDITEEGIVLLENDGTLPLDTGTPLNVFGWASVSPTYGGSGSGALSGIYENVSLLQGLEDAGFELNSELTEFSDQAVIVIARPGSEGVDIPDHMSEVSYNNNSADYDEFPEEDSHYLELSQSEKNMISLVCENFDNVILIYNGSETFELGFIEDYPQIKSLIYCPAAGQTGFEALGSILCGDVNPSGKTVDLFAADFTDTPTYNNFGDFFYTNMDEYSYVPEEISGGNEVANPSFVNYVEGIYVGYRFYETAADEGFLNYDEEVLYPFGYGMSYTTFEQEMGEMNVSDGMVSFDVTVTNTGDTAGKDTVEVYYNPPYTNGGIEKATANLVAFEKTELLNPGASQTIEISFALEDMASFDTYGEGCYVLEAGDYGISIRSDSHNIISEQTYTQSEDIVYNEDNKRSSDDVVATVQFSDVEGDVTYLSRADGFANYEEATAAPENYEFDKDTYLDIFTSNLTYDVTSENDPDDEMPVTGADNGIMLADMRGLDYDDPQWEDFLDQLTFEEMRDLVAYGG